MALLTNPEQIPRKTLTFFFVVENSAAMSGKKLETVNMVLEHYISLLQYYAATITNAEIKIALLSFCENANWITERPVEAEKYIWSPLPAIDDEAISTDVSFDSVFSELNQKLSKNVFMNSPVGALPPVIIFFSTSSGTENAEPLFAESFNRLSKNNWDKNALKLAFAIGKTANIDLLEKWTGDIALTLFVKNPQMFLDFAVAAGRLCVDIATRSVFAIDSNEENIPLRRLKLKNALNEILFLKTVEEPKVCYNPPEALIDVFMNTSFNNDFMSREEAIESAKNLVHRKIEAQAAFEDIGAIAVEYKNSISKNFVSLDPSHIDDRIGGKRFFVTRKYDGELAVLSWNGNSLAAANSSGKPYKDLLCLRVTALQLKKSGIKDIVFAAELYCDESAGRSRVSDCLSSLAGKGDELRLAPFDIISIDEKSFKSNLYNETYRLLQKCFGENEYCKPVKYIEASSRGDIKRIFSEWVETEGSEGLVIRSDIPIVYKLKPRITVDAAVVGFSESSDTKGQVRTLLYALRGDDGKYQIIGRTGSGLTVEQKAELYSRLMPMKVSSNYLEVDSNRLAFHMIRPELVIELSIGDVIAENTSGSIRNPLLEYDNGALRQTGITAGYSFISAVIERLRGDKTVRVRDVSLAQISGRIFSAEENGAKTQREMPASRLLRRDVWVRGNAVQKLLVWKTNKELFGFPAYSASWTTFIPNTAEPFKVDMRVTNSETQINQLAEQFIVKNIKSGWTKE